MKATNIREHTDDELEQLYLDTSSKLSDHKIKRAMGDESDQPLLIRERRRDVARILTVMKERGL